MLVRELERLLAEHGVGAAKLDAVTRKLREASKLPKSGRGPNAPHIGAQEAACILIAVAGSTKGTEADVRLAKLAETKCGRFTLADTITALLAEPSKLDAIELVKVGRTTRHADVVHADGSVSAYRSGIFDDKRFRVEGVLPAALLKLVASALSDDFQSKRQGARRV